MKSNQTPEVAIQWLQRNAKMDECRITPDSHLIQCYLSVSYGGKVHKQVAYGHTQAQACQRAAVKLFHRLN